jgi:hypothetical protein
MIMDDLLRDILSKLNPFTNLFTGNGTTAVPPTSTQAVGTAVLTSALISVLALTNGAFQNLINFLSGLGHGSTPTTLPNEGTNTPEPANAATDADTGGIASVSNTRIIDGAAATNWLTNEGFLNPDGTVTPRFTAWYNQGSSDSPDPSGFDAIAGEFDISDGRINGDIAIVVRDPDTVPHDRPPAPAGAAAQNVTENFAPGVDITGTHEYIQSTRHYLNTIAGTPAGDELNRRILLDGFAEGHTVNIVDPGGNVGNSNTYTNSPNHHIQADGTPRGGSNSTLAFNPYRHSLPGARMNPDGTPDMTDWRNRPPDVGLEHELNHSYHGMTGSVNMAPTPNPVVGGDAPSEDLRTVGIGPFGEDPVCENTYRSQRGLVPRPHY